MVMQRRPNQAPACDLLFAYGTLRRGFELHAHLARLRARYLGEAAVAGELFDLGCYPGARRTAREGKRIRGEVYQLRCPAHDLRVLDEVEGIKPGARQRSEFVRDTAEVILDTGERRHAWVYWLRGKGAPAPRIISGDYAARLGQR